MVVFRYTYSEEEVGWVSQNVKITEPTSLSIPLTERGRIIIKASARLNETFKKVYVSPDGYDAFELDIDIDDGCEIYIQVVTSVEPIANNSINFDYSSSELGWVSEKVKLSVGTKAAVKLSDNGRVAIKKSNSENGEFPKVYISPDGYDEFEFDLYGDVNGKYVQIISSAEPIYISIK